MSLVLTKRQRVIIQGTIHQAKTRYAHLPVGLQRRGALIAIAVMFAESGCKVLANGNVPASWTIPHDRLEWSFDGMGHDHASVGSYQQQTGTAWTVPKSATTMGTPNGWGTPAQLMDPATAAGKFFAALDRRGGDWQAGKTPPWWRFAQNVQVSSYNGVPREANNYSRVYGGNYKSQGAKAHAALALLWPTVSVKKPAKPLPAPKPSKKPSPKPKPAKKIYFTITSGWYLGRIAARFYGSNTSANRARIVALNKAKYPSLVSRPDYVRVGWKLRVK